MGNSWCFRYGLRPPAIDVQIAKAGVATQEAKTGLFHAKTGDEWWNWPVYGIFSQVLKPPDWDLCRGSTPISPTLRTRDWWAWRCSNCFFSPVVGQWGTVNLRRSGERLRFFAQGFGGGDCEAGPTPAIKKDLTLFSLYLTVTICNLFQWFQKAVTKRWTFRRTRKPQKSPKNGTVPTISSWTSPNQKVDPKSAPCRRGAALSAQIFGWSHAAATWKIEQWWPTCFFVEWFVLTHV